MPSLQQIEKIAERLERYTTYKTLQAQVNARYILYGVHEDEANFPLFDRRLTFRTENMAYLCLEVACTYYINARREKASEYFNRGALLLEYDYANSQIESEVRGFNLMVCGLAYYCAHHYSKAFVTISKGRYDGRISEMVFSFLKRRFGNLESEIKEILLPEENDKGENTPLDILLARAFSLMLNYFYYGNQHYLDEAIAILKDATELALLEEDVETWWIFRLLSIVFDGFNESSLWKNLHDHPLFTVDDNGWKEVWEWLGMPEKDWDASAKEKLEQYIHSQTFKKTPITELFASQRKSLEQVLKAESSVVSMPTSSGKTRIAEIVILQSLLRDTTSKVLYIAPFRSLAFEVEETLSSTFTPIGFYVTHLYGGAQITALDRSEMENARVVIATPEKAKAILRINDEELRSIKLVVMDEGHLIGARPREIANEMFTEELRRTVRVNGGKFLLLSAVLPNAGDISRWLSGKTSNVVHDTWRPSSQRLGLMCYRGNRVDLEWKGEVACFNSGFVRTDGDKKQAVAEAALKLSELGSVLIYVPRKDWVLSNARTMYGLLKDEDDIDWNEDDLDWMRFQLVCEESEEDHEYVKLAKKGILCHSSKLKTDVRRYMERLLRKGKARFIYATNTLAQGVNLGVSTVIVLNVVIGRNTFLSTNDFWNMAGRAGRSYIDTEGKILFVCDFTKNEWKARYQAGLYLDIIETDKAVSGVYAYLKKLCDIQQETGIDFEQLLEIITENRLEQLPQEEVDLTWNEFFELIDDSLLTLDVAYRESEDDDAGWVEEHFRDSLAVIQEEDEALRVKHLEIIKARVRGVRKIVKGDQMPQAFASSGIPLKAALYLDEKVFDLMRIADEYLNSQRTLDDKLYFFYQFDQMAQDIPSERIEVPEMDVLEGIRKEWISGQAMGYNEISLAQDYYGNTVSWLMNALVSRFNEEDDERFKECYEEMSLSAAYGLPSKWAAQIYLCGISSRNVATELSGLVMEPEDANTLGAVATYLRNHFDEIVEGGHCSELAKKWMEMLKMKPSVTVTEIQSVNNFYFGKSSKEDIPEFLLCKKTDKHTYLCSVDLKFHRSVRDTENLPFSEVADVPGVFFMREGDVWKMKNVNPYITVRED